MIDNEIIIPLKCLVMNESYCRHCKLKDKNDKCQKFLYSDVLGLIDENNRQKAEIKRLTSGKCVYLSDDETTEYCVEGPCPKYKTEEQIKAEAVKEFAKRLKDYYIKNKRYDRPYAHTMICLLFGLIDDIVKEMVGETDV